MNINPMISCSVCPRDCKIDRTAGNTGYCKAYDKIKIARNALHFWEEPSISGTCGSGTVFFSGCNMKCVFCQNYKISTKNVGKEVNINELSDIFLDLQEQKAHNINLVTPTHYAYQISKSLEIAKKNGLIIPVVYNTGGYEKTETIDMLDGLVDIYMPDMKYYDDRYAIKYSKAKNYFTICKNAINQMYNQVGKNQFDTNGIMTKGVIVRHMMLPGLLFDSKKIIDYLYNTYKNNVYISIMSQYTPCENVKNYPEINKPVTQKYYSTLVDYAESIGVENAYIQSIDSVGEVFIPDFYIN